MIWDRISSEKPPTTGEFSQSCRRSRKNDFLSTFLNNKKENHKDYFHYVSNVMKEHKSVSLMPLLNDVIVKE